MQTCGQALLKHWTVLCTMGVYSGMEEYERRKLIIFNQLNCISMLCGLLLIFAGLASTEHLPPLTWYVAISPMLICTLVLLLNRKYRYRNARLAYFGLYPMVTCIVYLGRADVGISLFFLLYIVMAVFFLHHMTSMIVSFCWSSSCFVIAVVVPREYEFRLADISYWIFAVNHMLALGFIFYALFLIKQEHMRYQYTLVVKSRELHQRNTDIAKKKKEIAEKAALLELQTQELTELNQVKNKLFSVIAHDLKTPMYALRNLFLNMQRSKMSARELKELLPGISNEMNYVTSLMENLLVWSRSQMKHESVQPEVLDLQTMITETMSLLGLQADNKKIWLEATLDQPVYCYADREMLRLVLRNLLSNAIKFTPAHGTVWIGATEHSDGVEISVQDTGIGMTPDTISQLFGEIYFSTRGTHSETGTGLGLKLCKEFLEKNGGSIRVNSNPGQGSTFSVILPRYEFGRIATAS
ncbi:HAMP domain-containing histidine kinase [Pseudoflavitalea sp. G-6-1-2]|uniref:sensor histidine kinase n=1 Tax=Pseudoflavitalea sp. G-6-1-2 TaxID=2728841 RepID=UPI00146DB94D|nr:HAMP domain-containing sensor histidine kinase [Pseudoflavitalea sp. G-6-1-2]NML23611.1 HAMP domain-containing histidine kinase [Pseudoflavitalea sp. G-6-1-2]